MNKQKIIWFLQLAVSAFIVGGLDAAVAADDPGACASAKIVSGDSCKDLKVKMDLTQCKSGGKVDAQVKCGSGVGTASVESGGGTYTVDLKETWGGTWAVSGPVKFTPPAVAVTSAAPVAAAPSAGVAIASGSTTTFTGAVRLRYDDNFAKLPAPTAATGGPLHTNYTSIRIRPNWNIKVNPDLSVVFEPQFAKTFGAVAWVSSAATNTATESAGNPAYNGSGDFLSMSQAFVEMKMDYGLSLQAGRLALAYGDHIVLGSTEWTDFARRFDALKLRYTQDKSYVDVISAKIVENNKTTNASSDASPSNDDKDMNGIYASWNVNDNLKALEAYYMYQYDARASNATPPAALTTARPVFFGVQGLRFVSAFDNIGWKGEYAQNLGSEGTEFIATGQKDSNDMMDTEVSYNLNDSMKTRVALQYFKGGKNWKEFYPTTAKQLGIVDVVGRRNLSGFGLHYTASYGERFAVDADYYAFKRTSTDTAAYGLSAVLSSASSTSDDIGSEIDLVGKFIASKNLTWSLGMNVFLPGTYVKEIQNAAATDTGGRVSHYGYVMADVKF